MPMSSNGSHSPLWRLCNGLQRRMKEDHGMVATEWYREGELEKFVYICSDLMAAKPKLLTQ